MQQYELVLVVPSGTDKEAHLSNMNKLQHILSNVGGKVLNEKDWGIKQMAYPIKNHEKAQYFIWKIELKPTMISEMNRLLNFEQNLLRYLLLQVSSDPVVGSKEASLGEGVQE